MRVVLIALSALFALANGAIYYEGCTSLADRPETAKGFFYNLCIRNEKFVRRRHPFQFIESDIVDSEFNGCTFANTDTHSVNFTASVFNNVLFKNSIFSSFDTSPKPILIEKTSMRSATFEGCRFDKSAAMMFTSFELTDVTFRNCIFESIVTFELGQLQDVSFINCKFQDSPPSRNSTQESKLLFSKVTTRRMSVLRSKFLYPIKFENADLADTTFNETTFDEFRCRARKDGFPDSTFNDTIVENSAFTGKVACSNTEWRRMMLMNVTFRKDADFSRSKFEDMWWDSIEMPEPSDKSCSTLDLSESWIQRERLANMTIACQMDMSKSNITRSLTFYKVKARDFLFTETRFDQGDVDGKCCTEICPIYNCRCNYTRSPTDRCPRIGLPVDMNAVPLVQDSPNPEQTIEPSPEQTTAPNNQGVCFPANANLYVVDGTVRMSAVRHGEQAFIGVGRHSEVYFFGHRSAHSTARFVQITHSGQHKPLVISPRHYLYVNDRLATASTVRVGHRLRDADGYAVLVTDIDSVVERGLYAPTSLHGDLIVDGIRVSSYTAAVHPTLAHWLLSPLRLAYRSGLRRIVERFTILDDRSFEPVARALWIPKGPPIV